MLTTKQVIFRIIILMAIVEFLIMIVFGMVLTDLSPFTHAIIDATALVFITTPIIYFNIIKPYNKAKEKLIAQQSKMAILLNTENKKINSLLKKTIKTIMMLVEERDPYTNGHQYRVAKLAQAIAQKNNLPKKEVHQIYLGALIHDIGKVRIPMEILTSPTRLKGPEFELIKLHPSVGHKIASTAKFSNTILDIILHHHERLNGSGYPDGLSKNEVLLGARIVAVADVFESMTTGRPYRPYPLSIEDAIDELQKGVGTLYDQNVVTTCVDLITKDGFILPSLPYLQKDV